MIGIDWIFIGGASSVVGVAILDKLSEEYGFSWLGRVIKVGLQLASIGTGFYLFEAIAGVFL